MAKSALFIEGIEVPLLGDVPIPVTYSIEDIRHPDQTSADYALTVELPGSPELDKIFEFIDDPGISLQNFNPNLKTDVIYRLNETESFVGSLQLVKAMVNRDKRITKYICNFIGHKMDLFYAIGDEFLTGNVGGVGDLDFSTYNHAITVTNVSDSWSNTNVIGGSTASVTDGVGYRYALIDFGYSGSGSNGGDEINYWVQHLRPVLFLREYLDKIFSGAGKTWTSTFLDSAFFKKIVIPTCKAIEITLSDQLNRQCYVGTTGIPIVNGLSYSGTWSSGTDVKTINFDDNTTAPLTDPGGMLNTSSHYVTIPNDGTYTLVVDFDLNLHLNNTGSSIGPSVYYLYDYSLTISTQIYSGGGIWVDIGSTVVESGSASGTFGKHIHLENTINAVTGNQIQVVITSQITNADIQNNLGNSITDGSSSYSIDIANFSDVRENTFRVKLANLYVNEGDNVEVNQCILQNIKKRDFLKSVMQTFNLYMMVDRNDPNNYIIEPEQDFFSGSMVDWTSKLDISKDIEHLIMGELDAKKYTFTMTSDEDYYNKLYQANWKKNYGYSEIVIQNQFLKNEKAIETIFSPTPLVGGVSYINSSLFVPKIYSFENSEYTLINCKPRLLIWGGLLSSGYSSSGHTWVLKSKTGDAIQNNYPYAWSLDNPFTPSFDLNFGTPYEIYVSTYPPYTGFTGIDNITSVYWKPFIDSISDPNSRIIRAYFNLTEVDINKLDFRNPIFVDGIKYRLNKIENFDLTKNETTLVELLKLG